MLWTTLPGHFSSLFCEALADLVAILYTWVKLITGEVEWMEPMLVHRSSVVSISRRRIAGLVACSVDDLVTSKHSINFEI